MNSKIAIQAIDNALEKQDTDSNMNFTLWDKEDALNKGMNDLIRRQIHGGNVYREGAEESTMNVDDLQPILVLDRKMSVTNGDIYADSIKLPADYRYYNRLAVKAQKEECGPISIKSYFVENGNVDDYLKDWTFSPSYDFEQAFHTLASNKFRIYHNGDFAVKEIALSYYKNPLKISCEKKDFDTPWQWKDDFAELIIDEAVKLLAGNTESQNAFSLASQRTKENI